MTNKPIIVPCNGFFETVDVVLTPGVICADAEFAYSNGQCHALAYLLHLEHGYTLYEGYMAWDEPPRYFDDNGVPTYEGYEEEEYCDHVPKPNHFAVRYPDDAGALLDIRGLDAPETTGMSWYPSNAVRIIELVQNGDYRALDLDAAASFIPPLLEKIK